MRRIDSLRYSLAAICLVASPLTWLPVNAMAQDLPSVIVTRVAERDVTPQFIRVGRVEAVETYGREAIT